LASRNASGLSQSEIWTWYTPPTPELKFGVKTLIALALLSLPPSVLAVSLDLPV
jgi:hypothetical protein